MAVDLDAEDLHEDLNRKREKAIVYTWPFLEQLQGVLVSPEIMENEDNIVKNDIGDPFEKYVPNQADGGEIHSFRWYQETYNKYITDPRKQILMGIILYFDKTGVDRNQKYGCEPGMWTLSIFRRDVRCKHYAWFPLGYIPDIDKSSTAKSTLQSGRKKGKGRNHRAYMRCMARLLLGLRNAQED